ncbi:MAG: ABC transporter ATP-binding protein [Eubacterium sp.]|nr:ABC transporter ATP-binding protein [Eubacterium sp.]
MIRTFKRFFAFCRPEDRRKFKIAIFIGIFTAMLGALRIPALGLVVTDVFHDRLSGKTALLAILILIVSLIFTIAAKMKTTMLQTEGGYETCAYKRIEIAEKMRYLPMGFYNRNSLGKITNVTTTVMDGLSNVATRVVMLVTQGIITALLITVSIFFFDWMIGLTCLIGIGLFLLINEHMIRLGELVSKDKTAAYEHLTGSVLSYVQGIVEVKNYNLTGSSMKQLDQAITEKEHADFSEKRIIPTLCLQKIIVKLTGVAVCAFSVIRFLSGAMSGIYAVVFMAASFLIYESLDTVSSYSSLLRSVDRAVSQANEILETKGMAIDGEEITPEHHDIVLKDVAFSYEDQPIFKNLSLAIPENKMTAIVGPSGSGKTTLAKLMARFWDVDQGQILLGGTDLRKMSYDSMIRNFSFVFQNVYLFEDTIANNIRFGAPDTSMEDVIAAAKKACCHDFIMSLPDGYDTVIGEGGQSLSGGEKQRISIARALLKDAPVIILDEATANVDPENEAELTEAVEALTRNKTVIMIAHRLKTVRHADKIVVLNHGEIAEEGTHEQLMQEAGIYRKFVDDRQHTIGWRIAADSGETDNE